MTRRSLIAVALAAMCLAANLLAGCTSSSAVQQARSDWSLNASDLLQNDIDLGVNISDASLDEQLRVLSITPLGSNVPSFSYYDSAVQDRLTQAVAGLQCAADWTADSPLAILNPFGTGSNGLYLYFKTEKPATVSYTIRSEGTADFTRTARNVSVDKTDATDASPPSTVHSFQIIGLVHGQENTVSLDITDEEGVVETVTFEVALPASSSGYPVHLDQTQGASEKPLSDGLYALMRVNGYLNYGFFFDNDGVLRYEMIAEGFGLDRLLVTDDGSIVCTSTEAIACIDGLGRVTAVHRLNGYGLHHDINRGPDGTVIALAEKAGRQTVEDVVIEIDLTTGQVSELIDFSTLMADFVEEQTHPIQADSMFSWQAGEWDWIHLNSVEYLEEEDSLIVSSRETSTIIKVADIHASPRLAWLIGDASIWESTPYEELSLRQVGDFTPQYGQHAVTYDGDGPTEKSYYLLLFDNNFWVSVTRDGFSPDLTGTDVGTDLYEGTASYVYRYLVDEEARTFELVDTFAVPYSSIVSNAVHAPETGNFVVNSGVGGLFGEYDSDGILIRQFSYPCEMQGYRAFKETFEGFWFS